MLNTINTVDTPKLSYPVVMIEIEQKMIDIDGTNTILYRNISDQEEYRGNNK